MSKSESGAGAAVELTTFSESWLTITYPKNFKIEKEFRGEGNMLKLTNPANRDFMFIVSTPLPNMSFKKYCSIRQQGKEANVIDDHPLFPGANETRTIVSSPNGFVAYREIIIPVGDDKMTQIDVAATGKSEEAARLALEEWASIIDSIKIEPEKTVHIEWDGIERFQWDGTAPATFNYTFHPDFGFINFRDSQAEPVFDFSDQDFDQGIAKDEMAATFFISDALEVPAGFHFQQSPPDPADPAWAVVVEGLISLNSGQLLFGSGTNSEEAAVCLPPGVYRFRAYSAVVDYESEDNSQEVRFYFNRTDEKENNQIALLKRGEED